MTTKKRMPIPRAEVYCRLAFANYVSTVPDFPHPRIERILRSLQALDYYNLIVVDRYDAFVSIRQVLST